MGVTRWTPADCHAEILLRSGFKGSNLFTGPRYFGTALQVVPGMGMQGAEMKGGPVGQASSIWPPMECYED